MGEIVNRLIAWYCRRFDGRLRRRVLANARKHPQTKPERGITVVGKFETRGSLSKVMRDFVRSLRAAGIPCQTFSTSVRRKVPKEDIDGLLTPADEFRAGRYECVVEMFDSVYPAEELGLRRATVAFWEFTSGLFAIHPQLARKPLLIGMSDFNADYFKSVVTGSNRAIKVLYPFRPPTMPLPDCRAARRRFGFAPDDFIVLFNFDYGSSIGRKNPDGALRAFARGLGDCPRAKIVFKTQNAATHQPQAAALRALAAELGISDRFVSIDHYLPEADVYALTQICDAYLSLHRGEGFGLGIAEAMSFGKPVVVTDYSSTTEFCKQDNAMLVPCRLIPLRKDQIDHPFLTPVTEWAEPDVDAAAHLLRRLYDDPSLRERIGRQAKRYLAEHFSLDAFRASVNAFLDFV